MNTNTKRRKAANVSYMAKVKEIEPEAFSHHWRDCYIIYKPQTYGGNLAIGNGKTAALAWLDAYQNLKWKVTVSV